MDRISIITLALAKKFTKDTVAALEQVVRYIGVTTTAISDGSTTNPITIKGQSVTAVAGDTVFYNGTSYAWDGNAWQEVMNIAEIITAVEALGGRVHDILGDIAPEFNSASAYAVDDVVLYEDDLYIFTNAHTGAWDSGDVTVTSIAQLVDDLRAEIASTNERVSALETHVTQSGDVIDSDNHSLHIVGEAIETEKTVSGNPITLTDALPYNAVSLSAEIEAEQDLHGYDKPWAGGSGKNKYPILISADSFSNQGGGTHSGSDGVLTVNVSAVDDGVYSQTTSELNKAFDNMPIGNVTYSFYMKASEAGNVAIGYLGKGNTWINATTSWVRYNITYNKAESGTANFIIYNKVAGARTIEIKDFMIEVGNSMSSFAPYSNICPISGRTQEKLTRLGKNIFNGEYDYHSTSRYTPVSANTQYTISSKSTGARHINYHYIYNDDSFGENTLVVNIGDTFGSVTVSTPSNVKGIEIFVNGDATNTGNYAYDTQIENGAIATDYEPYKGINVIIQLGQTVYGGTLNVTTGVMTIEWVCIVDASALNTWVKAISNYGSFECTVTDAIKVADAQKLVISSCYNGVSKNGASAGADNYIYTPNSVTIKIKDTAKNSLTASEFAATLSGQQICYELATPTTIQLTPTDLQMLKGYNRLSSDGGGDITLTYRANKADSVQAEVDVLENTKADNADVVDYIENGNTASRAYSANQFILWKGDLYKVTTSIASGATITAGTNVSKTSIGAVLTALLNA